MIVRVTQAEPILSENQSFFPRFSSLSPTYPTFFVRMLVVCVCWCVFKFFFFLAVCCFDKKFRIVIILLKQFTTPLRFNMKDEETCLQMNSIFERFSINKVRYYVN